MYCATASNAGDHATVWLSADREHAAAGEVVQWTVWAELASDAPPDAYCVGLLADLRASDVFAGQVETADALMLPQHNDPILYGASLLDVLVYEPGLEERPLLRQIPILQFQIRITDASRPLWYDISGKLVTATIADPNRIEVYERLDGRSTRWEYTLRVVTDIVNHPGCNAVDLAAPFGQIDASDTVRFIELFLAGAPVADVAMPYGLFDIADIARYFEIYNQGCAGSL